MAPEQGPDRTKDELGRSECLVLDKDSEAEKPEVGVPTEDAPIQLSSAVWCVLLCLCAKTVIAWFLLWIVRLLTKAELSELEGSVGGFPGWPSLSV